jgi:hypothetical protein
VGVCPVNGWSEENVWRGQVDEEIEIFSLYGSSSQLGRVPLPILFEVWKIGDIIRKSLKFKRAEHGS